MKIKNLHSKLIATAVVIAYSALSYIIPHTCIIKRIIGVDCLGCGMTRAVVSALKFDFKSAFAYHMMFWSLPLLYICFLLDGKLFRQKTLNVIFYVLIISGFIANRII